MYERKILEHYRSDLLKELLVERGYHDIEFKYTTIKAKLGVGENTGAIDFVATANGGVNAQQRGRQRGFYSLKWTAEEIYKKVVDKEVRQFIRPKGRPKIVYKRH